MKSIANCEPKEFLKQANRIRHSVANWLTVTDVMNIRRNYPEPKPIPEDATDEQKAEIEKRNDEALREQIKKNWEKILDSVMEEHADETLEVLALCCFVEPKDISKHSVVEYIRAFNELISNKDVLDFFTSLVRLGRMSF